MSTKHKPKAKRSRGYKASRLTEPLLQWTGETTPAAAPAMDRRSRRVKVRRELKAIKRTVRIPVSVADIPAGSVLSDQTIQDIAAGNYSLVQFVPARQLKTPRRLTYHERCLERGRAKKHLIGALA